MKRTVTLRPGMRGTKQLTEQYGDALMYVRYRYDGHAGRKCKTVELIVHEGAWQPPNGKLWLRMKPTETALRRQVMAGGGRWNKVLKLWHVPAGVVRELGLEGQGGAPAWARKRNCKRLM